MIIIMTKTCKPSRCIRRKIVVLFNYVLENMTNEKICIDKTAEKI